MKKRKHIDSSHSEIGVSSPRERPPTDDTTDLIGSDDDVVFVQKKRVKTEKAVVLDVEDSIDNEELDEDSDEAEDDDEPDSPDYPTSRPTKKKERKERKGKQSQRMNSPRSSEKPSQWSKAVWETFSSRLIRNKNSKGKPYYNEVPMTADPNAPQELHNERCHNPAGSQMMMVSVGGKEYQRPLHRLRQYLALRAAGQPLPDSLDQSSHLCQNLANVGGTGKKQCSNPDHMVLESDRTNKSRQRCAGWVWILPRGGNPGNFWYPTCTHSPPCLRFTPKTTVPTTIALNRNP
jgi:Zinc-binding loop region of homing endonuclease